MSGEEENEWKRKETLSCDWIPDEAAGMENCGKVMIVRVKDG